MGAGQKRWESLVAGFGRGQRNERGAGCRLPVSRSGEVGLDRDADEKGIRQQDKGDMAVPAEVAAVG